MKNKIMTAVEWLIEEIHKNIDWIPVPMQEQALKMEKEQITEAFKHGELPPLFVNYNAEQYYNETYKKEDK
jgi:hypothetical protein